MGWRPETGLRGSVTHLTGEIVRFAELLDRRQSLSMDAVDAATMDSILDTIRARIHFLQSLHRRNAKNSGSSNFEVG